MANPLAGDSSGDGAKAAENLNLKPIEIELEPNEFLQVLFDTLHDLALGLVAQAPLILFGLVLIGLTWGLNKAVQRAVDKVMRKRKAKGSMRILTAKFASIIVWTLGLMTSATIILPGLSAAEALGGLGILSIGLSFAFKNIFENFFTGVVILSRFPFEVGDYIKCNDMEGQVKEVTTRMVQLVDTSGELLLIPNTMLFTNPVEVLTFTPTRRVEIMAGVAYGEDVATAVDVITKAVESCESVNKDKKIQVFPQGFGSSSIDIEVTWWTGSKPVDLRSSRGEVVTAIKKALDDANIEIPFPYRTLVFKDDAPLAHQPFKNGQK